MRWVDPSIVEDKLPPGWLANAKDALVVVSSKTGKERADAINKKNDIWAQVKDALWETTHGKCWYCESEDPRSDNAVDHFRPKNSIAEAKHLGTGYWWLAFDWRNYRFSCTYCNSYRKSDGVTGGKQHHFPLMDENARATGPEPADAIDAEEPKLLDPMIAGDFLLLSFDPDSGEAVPANQDHESCDYMRAKESIVRYHLNQRVIVKLRKKRARKVRNKLRDAQKHYNKMESDLSAKRAYGEHLAELLAMIKENAIYSSACRATLKALRAESIIAQKVLDSA